MASLRPVSDVEALWHQADRMAQATADATRAAIEGARAAAMTASCESVGTSTGQSTCATATATALAMARALAAHEMVEKVVAIFGWLRGELERTHSEQMHVLASREAQLEQSKEDEEAAWAQVEQALREAAGERARSAELAEEVSDKQRRIAEQSAALLHTGAINSELRRANEELRAERQRLGEEISRASAASATLSEELAASRQQGASDRDELVSQRAELLQTQRELAALSQALSEREARLGESEAALAHEREQLSAARSLLAHLRDDVARLRTQSLSAAERLSGELTGERRDAQELRTECARLERRGVSLEQERDQILEMHSEVLLELRESLGRCLSEEHNHQHKEHKALHKAPLAMMRRSACKMEPKQLLGCVWRLARRHSEWQQAAVCIATKLALDSRTSSRTSSRTASRTAAPKAGLAFEGPHGLGPLGPAHLGAATASADSSSTSRNASTSTTALIGTGALSGALELSRVGGQSNTQQAPLRASEQAVSLEGSSMERSSLEGTTDSFKDPLLNHVSRGASVHAEALDAIDSHDEHLHLHNSSRKTQGDAGGGNEAASAEASCGAAPRAAHRPTHISASFGAGEEPLGMVLQRSKHGLEVAEPSVGPVAEAGVRQGDVLVALNGAPIEPEHVEPLAFREWLKQQRANGPVQLTFRKRQDSSDYAIHGIQ